MMFVRNGLRRFMMTFIILDGAFSHVSCIHSHHRR